MIITTKHLYTVPTWTNRVGFCAKISRQWFACHNLSWSEFVTNGIDSEVLLATNDALAKLVVDHALAMEAAGHGQ